SFSFEAWVEDIIAHPDTALTVDEALAAADAANVVGSAGGLLKRATCGGSGWPRANVCLLFMLRAPETPDADLDPYRLAMPPRASMTLPVRVRTASTASLAKTSSTSKCAVSVTPRSSALRTPLPD